MNLRTLKVSSYLMDTISGYDKSYKEIAELDWDFENTKQIQLLMKFLNNWGCRQFAKQDHAAFIRKFKTWYKRNSKWLPKNSTALRSLSDEEIRKFAEPFNRLKEIQASINSNAISKSVGAVGAAKILFAISKNVFPPWDNITMKQLGYNGTGAEYTSYLIQVKDILNDLYKECKKEKIEIDTIPEIFGRKSISLVKLIDEYFYLKYTRKIDVEYLISICRI